MVLVLAGPAVAQAPAGAAADREAAFRAAGFPAVRGKHPACDKQQEATLEMRDLNGEVIRTFGRNPKKGTPAHYKKQKNEQIRLVRGNPVRVERPGQ